MGDQQQEDGSVPPTPNQYHLHHQSTLDRHKEQQQQQEEQNGTMSDDSAAPPSLKLVALQALCIVDHVMEVDEATLFSIVGDDVGGSRPCSREELQCILACAGEFHSKAGGSSANVARALSAGFGVAVDLVGTRGADEWGVMFVSSMKRNKVDTSKVRVKQGPTGRSAILSCNGQRTMRTFMSREVYMHSEDVSLEDFDGPAAPAAGGDTILATDCVAASVADSVSDGSADASAAGFSLSGGASSIVSGASGGSGGSGSGAAPQRPFGKWAFLSGYSFYSPGLLRAALRVAREAGCSVAMDLASWEVVSAHRQELLELLAAGGIDVCICNEDEAAALLQVQRTGSVDVAAAALALLARHVRTAVVTLGSRGCLATTRGREGRHHHQPAVEGVVAVDATGAGDCFTSGFLYGQMNGYSLERSTQIGCLAGAAAVRTMGAELSASDWAWFHAHMHGDMAAAVVAHSASEVQQELLQCHALVERLGRGVVYFGSARLMRDHAFWERTKELARQLAELLQTATTWSGGGPGMMRSVLEGAAAAGRRYGGIRISREAGCNVLVQDYLPPHLAFTCKYMAARKAALVEAGVRLSESSRTAYIFLPGGLGTMDELFMVMTLVQLQKLGSAQPVPLIIMNYDGFYDGLLALLDSFVQSAVLSTSEVAEWLVASTNEEVVAYLAEYYHLPLPPGITPAPSLAATPSAAAALTFDSAVALPPAAAVAAVPAAAAPDGVTPPPLPSSKPRRHHVPTAEEILKDETRRPSSRAATPQRHDR